MPADAAIAEARRQNSKIPVHRKLRVIGSFKVEIEIIEIFAVLSKTKELDIPKKERTTLVKKP